MRIAIISDTHFGDSRGTLVMPGANGAPVIGHKYEAFSEAAGQDNDYLVLLGDILDFSITNYWEAYEVARVFFRQVQADGIAEEMIFVPGNHDADLWHIVEHQVNIINRITKGEMPRSFRMSVPGIIDDRPASPHRGFTLAGVTPRSDADGPKYAGLFLDHIAKEKGEGEPMYFNFAYPNLYMVTDNESVLITHGHYFEPYWAFAGEWAMKIAGDDLTDGRPLSLKEMVGVNFPLSQLACSGIGQAGPLTAVARQVQDDVKHNRLQTVEKYLDRFVSEMDKVLKYPVYKAYRELLTDVALREGKKMLLQALANLEDSQFNEDFLCEPEVQERFRRFYSATVREINELNAAEEQYSIPVPPYVIFGHTHQPTSWGDEGAPAIDPFPDSGLPTVTLFNAGGWLTKDGEDGPEFHGADVFTYSTADGFDSVQVR